MTCRVIQVALLASVATLSFGQPGGAGGGLGSGLGGPGAGLQSGAGEATRDGFHLYNVSLFGGYSSSANPLAQSALPQQGNLGADENYGASFEVGWQHHREKDNFTINYNGSYAA